MENLEQLAKQSAADSLRPGAAVLPFQRFDNVAATANLSLHVNDLMSAMAGSQAAFQHLGQHFGQLMQAHNAMASRLEQLEQTVKSLTKETPVPDNGTPCTQNGTTLPC